MELAQEIAGDEAQIQQLLDWAECAEAGAAAVCAGGTADCGAALI